MVENSAYGIDSGSGTNPPESPLQVTNGHISILAVPMSRVFTKMFLCQMELHNVDAWVKVSNTAQ